jgi:electron transport complex protein RnfC
VRCGWCTDHCPARLNVAALNDAFELGDIAFADRAGALACVECGLCSYVCPARLPLSQRVRRLKRNLFQLRHRARKEKAS